MWLEHTLGSPAQVSLECTHITRGTEQTAGEKVGVLNDEFVIQVHIRQAFFFARFKKTQGRKNSKNLRPQKNSRAILNKKLSVLEST